jgi:hypothetical protein
LLVSLLGPASVGAQPAAPGVEELRAAFGKTGYDVDQAVTWPWQLPLVTSFHVTDQRGGRMLLVEVFLSDDDARIESDRKAGAARVYNVVLFQSGTRATVNEAQLECAPESIGQDVVAPPDGVDTDLINDVLRAMG